MNSIETLFIENMKRLRKQYGYTQETFADKLGVKRSRLAAWEERRACPSVSTMLSICELLGVQFMDMVTNPHLEIKRYRLSDLKNEVLALKLKVDSLSKSAK